MKRQLSLLLGALLAVVALLWRFPIHRTFATLMNSGTPVTAFGSNPYVQAGGRRARRVAAIGCARTAREVLDRDAIVGVALPSPEPDWSFLFAGVPRVGSTTESLAALAPDLVAVTDAKLSLAIGGLGVRVVVLPPGDPDPEGVGFEMLAAAAGVPERGPAARTLWLRRSAFERQP